MKSLGIITLLFICHFFLLEAQISRGGEPMLNKIHKAFEKPYRLPVDIIQKRLQQAILDQENIRGKKPLTVAVEHAVSLNTGNSGKWYEGQQGLKIWRLEIESPRALGLAIFFDSFQLKENTMLFLYDPAMKYMLGGFNHRTNKKSGVLQSAFIPGDRIIIELQVRSPDDFGEFNIGSVSHAFVDIFGLKKNKDGYFGSSGNCETDINCPEGEAWQTIKRSVCRVIFKRNAFTTEICTGALINNTAQDGKAYFYTANHCIKRISEAESAVIYFDYESPECDGTDGDASLTLSSTEIVATSDSLDFTLLLLSEDPPESYKPYFAGWSRVPLPPAYSATIHHPRGDVKKISADNDPAAIEYQEENPPSWLYNGSAPQAFWRIVDWETGATEGGSSGCPLFNQVKLIVGNLTGGDASCNNPVNDYFTKFYLNWDYYPEPDRRLKPWLDPLNADVEFLDGYDPYDIPDPFQVELFSVYPNPGRGFITIHTDTLDISQSKIRVFNINGSVMVNYNLKTREDAYLDLSHFENGIYIIEISFEGYIERKKVVIQK